MLGTVGLLVGVIAVIITIAVAGILAASVVGAVTGVLLLGLIIRDRHHRALFQRVGTRVGWRWARANGAHLYRSGPVGRTPWGTCQLPGLAAASRLSEGVDSLDRRFALVNIPTTGHFTVVFATEPDGASLVDEEQIDQWVAHWGNWLAGLGNEPGIVAVSVTVESAPDSGARLRREVYSHLDPDAPQIAQEMLREVVDTYPEGSATIRAWVALTFAAAKRGGGKRRSAEEMERALAARLPALSQRLAATGAGAARPMSAQQLCEAIRTAYDPPAARLFDAARSEGAMPTLTWHDVGPTASEATWDHYRHDAAISVTWAMSEAPRGVVQSQVLHQLLAPHAEVARKRVTMLYRPLDSAQAARIVEQDKRIADFRATSSQRPSARVMADQRAADASRNEEAAGAGLINFGMLVTATVPSSEELPDAEAAIDDLAATARIQLRRVHGSQDSAFAAALPLGLVLPQHLRVPSEIRAAL